MLDFLKRTTLGPDDARTRLRAIGPAAETAGADRKALRRTGCRVRARLDRLNEGRRHDATHLPISRSTTAGLPPPTPEIEQERKVAMFDLLEDNSFRPARARRREPCPTAPTRLSLSIRDKRLVFDVATEDGEPRRPSSTCRLARSGRW